MLNLWHTKCRHNHFNAFNGILRYFFLFCCLTIVKRAYLFKHSHTIVGLAQWKIVAKFERFCCPKWYFNFLFCIFLLKIFDERRSVGHRKFACHKRVLLQRMQFHLKCITFPKKVDIYTKPETMAII